jgi:hypothetical protein
MVILFNFAKLRIISQIIIIFAEIKYDAYEENSCFDRCRYVGGEWIEDVS